MRRNVGYLLLVVLLAVVLGSCGGRSTPVDPPDTFDKLTARVLGTNGQPLAGLSVRIGGENTGITTDANGYFTVPGSMFPNGPNASNQLSFGRGGFVVGSTDLVPASDPNAEITFAPDGNPGDPPPTGNGSISGHVYEASSDATLGPVPIAGAEVDLFSIDLGGVYQTFTDSAGAYLFDGVAAGNWQMTAYKDGYYPEMAAILLGEDVDLTYDFGLTAQGQIEPGEGIMVRGTITDSKTGAPIGGAFVSCMADTGYVGIPEMGIYDDMAPGGPATGGGGATEPGNDGTRSSSSMPWRYDPQYQETTTNADGTFEFPNPMVGYSVWLSYSKEGYLNGSYYDSIDGRTEDLELALTLDPIVLTDISGTVIDENGDPVKDAYVEFIFAMGGGGIMPMDYAVPGGMDLAGMAEAGTATKNDIGAPPPPPAAGAPGDASGNSGWDEWADGAAPMAGGGEAPPSGAGVDNEMMQRFRWEQQHGRGSSDALAPDFTGYYTATTGADGKFSFEDVPAGSYYVFASAYKHLPYNAELVAQEDPALNDFTLTCPNVPVGSVEGTVTDEDGTALTDVLITCTQPYVDPFAYTDENGHYRIDNVPAGDWIISGYKQGYLTASQDTVIAEDQSTTVNLSLTLYTPPEYDTVVVTGMVYNGADNTGVGDVSMVFTPTVPELGGYFRHVYTETNGAYTTDLIPGSWNIEPMPEPMPTPDDRPSGEYNLLIQKDGYEDLYTRIYVDPTWPTMDYWLWPVGGGGRGWGGGGIMPPTLPPDGGGTDPGDPPQDPTGGDGSVPGGEPTPL